MTPLHLAVQMKQFKTVNHLIITPNLRTVRKLLNLQTSEGKTPLQILKLLPACKRLLQKLDEIPEQMDFEEWERYDKLRELAKKLGFSEEEKGLLEVKRLLEVHGALELTELDTTTIDPENTNERRNFSSENN